MKKVFTKLIHLFLLTLIIILYYKILSPLSEIPFLFSDTLSEVFHPYPETFLKKTAYLFSSNPHNYYILSVLHVLFGNYIPSMLKVHPMEFAKSYYFYIYLIIFMLFVSTLAMNFAKYFKHRRYFYLLLPCLLFFFIKANYETGCMWFFAQAGFMYSYYLSPIFAILLFQKTEYSYVRKQILPKYNKGIIIYFCIFCCLLVFNFPLWAYIFSLFIIGDLIRKKLFKSSKAALYLSILIIAVSVCSEFYRFIIIASSIIGSLLHQLLIKNKVKIGELFSYFSIICFSMVANTFSNSYFSFAEDRTRSITDLMKNSEIYRHDFVTILFSYNHLLFVVLITLVVCSFVFVKNQERNKRFFIFNFSIFIADILFFVFAFPFNLNHFAAANLSILNYTAMIMSYKIILYYLIFSYAGYVIAFSERKIFKIQAVILTVIYIILSSELKTDFSTEQGYFKALKRKLYILERLFIEDTRYTKLGYSNYEEIIPPDYYVINYYIYNYAPKSRNKDYNFIKVCEEMENDMTCDNKMKKIVKEKTGYVFSEKELRELDFSIYNKYRTKY